MCSSLDVVAVPGVSRAVLQAAVVETETAIQALLARRAALLAEIDTRGAGCALAPDGREVPLAAWLRDTTGLGPGAARRAVDTARGLAAMPDLRAAAVAGEVRTDRCETLVAVLAPHLPAEALRECQPALRDLVEVCEPAPLRTALRRWIAQEFPDTFERLEARAETWVQLDTDGPGAWRLHGRLDAASTETLSTALDSLSRREGTDDHRSTRERRADALVELARRALDSGDLPSVGGQRPQVTLVLDVAEPSGDEAGISVTAAHGDHTGALSRTAALAIACDAEVSLALRTLATGRLVALTSPQRLVPPTLRRALAARDRGCTHRGCHVPAARCHAHHLSHWADGGATTIENLALLCPRHHAAWHRGQVDRSHLRLPGQAPPTQRATAPRQAPPPDPPPF